VKEYIKLEDDSVPDPKIPEKQGTAEHKQGSIARASEDQALATLQRADVSSEEIVALSRDSASLKSRKVLLALVSHPRAPRHVSIPLLRRMFTFDLVKMALTPTVAPDIKRAAEEQVLVRLESIPAGEKISLARRGPSRIVAELLKENDPRIISVALDNGRLVESAVVTTLMKNDAPALLYRLVSEHSKWSLRREVQIALLRSEKTPFDRAIELAVHFSRESLREIVPESRRTELAAIADS
jgi:hypothetical protein